MPSAGKKLPAASRYSCVAAGPPWRSSTLIRPLPKRLVQTLKVPDGVVTGISLYFAGAHPGFAEVEVGGRSPIRRRGRSTSRIGRGGGAPGGEHDRQQDGTSDQETSSDGCAGSGTIIHPFRRPGHVRHDDHVHLLLQRPVGHRPGAADDLEHQCRLARQRRLRRRPVVRGRRPRFRSPLPAGDPLGPGPAHAPAGHRGPRSKRWPARASRSFRPTPRSTSARCSGRRAGWCCRTPRLDAVRAGAHQDEPARSGQGLPRRACPPTAGPAPSRRPPTPRPRACIRWPAWPSPRRRSAASTTR